MSEPTVHLSSPTPDPDEAHRRHRRGIVVGAGLGGGCSAVITHREYRTPLGGTGVESLQITVALPGAPEIACDEARRLAGTAVPALDGVR